MQTGVPTDQRTCHVSVDQQRLGLDGLASSSAATLFLVTVAAVTLTALRLELAMSQPPIFVSTVLTVILPWLLWLTVRSNPPRRATFDTWFTVLLACWSAFPLIAELAWRRFGIGEPIEVVVLVALLNAAMLLAALGHYRRRRHAACVLSAALAMFATVMSFSPIVFAFAGFFGALLLWWLMARYWERVQQTHAATTVDHCLPVRASVFGVTALGIVLLMLAIGTSAASTHVLNGFMPTSGGSRDHDPYARAGVGDGDAMVAAQEDAMSFGPVESELFLESDMPSLYDMFNDMYGEAKPKKERERTIGLAPSNAKQTHQHISKTQRSGREFSAVRRRRNETRQSLNDRNAPAMLYLIGRVPLHLALQRYDTFDGRDWMHSGTSVPHDSLEVRHEGNDPWVVFRSLKLSSMHPSLESHAVKVINLKTSHIPSPPHLRAVHIDKLDRTDFFGWSNDDVAEMTERDFIPQLTVLRIRSHTFNSLELRDARPANAPAGGESVTRHLACPPPGPLAEQCTKEWAHGVRPGLGSDSSGRTTSQGDV